MPERETISLTNLYGGGAVEMFDRAMQECLKNIMDDNTTTEVRTITLTAKLQPDEKRNYVDIKVGVKRNLPGQPEVKLKAGLEIDSTGAAVALDLDQFQRKLPLTVNTIPIHKQ